MNLRTITSLECDDKEMIIYDEDHIKVYLTNGEILIGEYNYSDYESLTINRVGVDIDIMFDDIKDIKRA